MKEKVVTHRHDWKPYPTTNLGRYCIKCDKRQWKLMTGQWLTFRDDKQEYEPPIWDEEYDKIMEKKNHADTR
jgi:hypothetical protein